MTINETTNEVEALNEILASAAAAALENNTGNSSTGHLITDSAGNILDYNPSVTVNGYEEYTPTPPSTNDVLTEIINMITNLQEQILQIAEAVVGTQTTILNLHDKQMELSLLADNERRVLRELTKHILESNNPECKRLILEHGSEYTILKCSCDNLNTKWFLPTINNEAFFEERVEKINADFESQEILAANALLEDTEDTPIDLEKFKSPIDQLEP